LDHLQDKILVVSHLLAWGYQWEHIHWEWSPAKWKRRFRSDIFAEAQGNLLPAFWFECATTDYRKLRAIVRHLPHVRVVNVVNPHWFKVCWDAELDTKGLGRSITKKRGVVRRCRERSTVPGVEYWASHWTSRTGRFLWGVRREIDGRFTLLRTGECDWTISDGLKRYLPSERRKFHALLPGITH
jgi:hypothetical protein